MKKDIDVFMQMYKIDALLVTGPAQHNPAMVYMTGGAHMTNADLIKKRNETAVLFYNSIEREEAEKTRLVTRSLNRYPLSDLLIEAGNNEIKAIVLRYQRMLNEMGIVSGRLALYGQIDVGVAYAIFTALQQEMPGLTILGYSDEDILTQAMMTKDEHELERIRNMGQITTKVVSRVADFLTTHHVKGGLLVKTNGDPLCVRDVKRQISLWLAEEGAENPHGTIFSIGRDAGIPHNSGVASDIIRVGLPIVFDIYPCEAGGGYHYDLTRTWCLGHAPDEVYTVYEQVLSVYHQIINQLRVNEMFTHYQKMTCELFENLGHPTINTSPSTLNGYTHSVGHGLGLRIHERPTSGAASTALDILVPGSVFTIEPGLYYPERNLGVRLENSLFVTDKGEFETFVDYPMDLVLPIKENG